MQRVHGKVIFVEEDGAVRSEEAVMRRAKREIEKAGGARELSLRRVAFGAAAIGAVAVGAFAVGDWRLRGWRLGEWR